MDRLIKKYDHLTRAIASFNQAHMQYNKWKTALDPHKIEAIGIDYEGIVLNLRDSMIQRFEYSIDLLWKYLKVYLNEKLSITPDIASPNTVIREAGKARLISEEETHLLLDMIKKRNMTSHIYQEEIAELLSHDLPTFLEVMQTVSTQIAP